MSYELITLLMFSSLMVMLLTGQRVFGAIGFVAALAALLLWGDRNIEMPFNATFQVLNWYPLLTLPLFIFMGYMMSESGIANDLYRMFHVWMGRVRGGLAMGTIGLMVIISAMNGLSVAGMAIGASVALPELLRRGYDKIMVTGVIQAGSSLGILIPPSVVLVLYAMIARQPVLQLWLAGVIPGLIMATLFAIYIYIRCRRQPELGPALPEEELAEVTWAEKIRLLRAGIIPFLIFGTMMGFFLSGITSLVESSAVGAAGAIIAAALKRRLTFRVIEDTTRQTLAISCMFLDDTAMLVIVAPLYIPLVIGLGFNPIWFGILYVITCQIAYITPPFGYNLFLMRAMAPPEITLVDIYRSIVPFVGIMILTIVIVMAFPQLSLWLPDWYFGR